MSVGFLFLRTEFKRHVNIGTIDSLNSQTSTIFVLMNEEVKLTIYSADLTSELNLPFVDGGIKAGFPSPAQDYLT